MYAVFRGMRTRMVVLSLAVLLFAHAAASPTLFARGALMIGSAAASLSAAVPANPYNTLAKELAEREAALENRERALAISEKKVRASFSEKMAPYSFMASAALFALLALNFYFDWRGRRSAPYRISLR